MSKIKKMIKRQGPEGDWPDTPASGGTEPENRPGSGEARARPPAEGIALCLGQLADEAALMGMSETFAAIRCAIGTCLMEEAKLEAVDPDCAELSLRH